MCAWLPTKDYGAKPIILSDTNFSQITNTMICCNLCIIKSSISVS